jgi:hypothetical protein
MKEAKKEWVVYRYTGEDPIDWTWKRKTYRLVPGQFISRDAYLDLGKGVTIMQVIRRNEKEAA